MNEDTWTHDDDDAVSALTFGWTAADRGVDVERFTQQLASVTSTHTHDDGPCPTAWWAARGYDDRITHGGIAR